MRPVPMPSIVVRRRWPWAVLALLILLPAIPALLLADGDRLRRIAERGLTRQLRLPVHIGRMERVDGWWWAPDLAAYDVVIGQAGWVQSRAPLARLRTVRAHVSLPGLLFGRSVVKGVAIDGGNVAFRRNSDGRGNWSNHLPGEPRGSGEAMPANLTISRLHFTYDDKRRDRFADLMIDARPKTGIALAGVGKVRGAPVRLAAQLAGDGQFIGRIGGPTLSLLIRGQMDHPYSLSAFSARVHAKGRDLRDLDAIAEAGLPGTQPFALTGDLRHEKRSWIISALAGRVGRSTIDGAIRVDKQDDRSRLTGSLHAAALDFDDIASDEGRAKAAAKRAQLGPRIVPDTRIALDHLQRTDGQLDVRVDRLLWKTPAPFRTIQARIRLDHGQLSLQPLRIGLTHGAINGAATVTQRATDDPTLMVLDLRLQNGRIEDFAGGGKIMAALRGRIDVVGTGGTIRAAFATARGRVALVATGGTINRKVAELIGRNVGRALKADKDERVPLRCFIADLRGQNGRFATDPLMVDTAIARADGTGQVDWRTEALTMTVTGGSKVPAAFRLTGPLAVSGTIKQPRLVPSPDVISAKGVLKMVGKAIAGNKAPVTPDADCAGLAATTLR